MSALISAKPVNIPVPSAASGGFIKKSEPAARRPIGQDFSEQAGSGELSQLEVKNYAWNLVNNKHGESAKERYQGILQDASSSPVKKKGAQIIIKALDEVLNELKKTGKMPPKPVLPNPGNRQG